MPLPVQSEMSLAERLSAVEQAGQIRVDRVQAKLTEARAALPATVEARRVAIAAAQATLDTSGSLEAAQALAATAQAHDALVESADRKAKAAQVELVNARAAARAERDGLLRGWFRGAAERLPEIVERLVAARLTIAREDAAARSLGCAETPSEIVEAVVAARSLEALGPVREWQAGEAAIAAATAGQVATATRRQADARAKELQRVRPIPPELLNRRMFGKKSLPPGESWPDVLDQLAQETDRFERETGAINARHDSAFAAEVDAIRERAIEATPPPQGERPAYIEGYGAAPPPERRAPTRQIPPLHEVEHLESRPHPSRLVGAFE